MTSLKQTTTQKEIEMTNSLTIAQASALIAQAVKNGSATMDEANQMQKAIREKRYYGNTMTNETRARMMINRFGFFDI